MNLHRVALRLGMAATQLTAGHAWAQNAGPMAGAGFPDACQLLVKADLEALFPGMPVGNAQAMLSPVYQGPQYTVGCSYDLRLPSPTARMDVGYPVALTIIRCDACYVKDKNRAAESFADIGNGQERLAANLATTNSSRRMQVEPLSEVGDQALEVTSHDIKIYVRKDDLIFFVAVPLYSDQTRENAVALARQAAGRWRGGVGMVEAATAIAANTSVELPPDTREVTTAAPDKWPDACALLPPEDVRAVFGDMTVGAQQKTMGKITFASRVDRVEALPHPIKCSYVASKVTTVDGRRQTITDTIEVLVSNVSTTEDLAKRNYRIAARITGADTPIPGLGDEASIDNTNNIYVRKGVVTLTVRVLGDARDQALYADARKRANEIARSVAARQP